jgi:hypothetical protein
MKDGYRAVCDKHGEAIHVMVNNPTCSAHYLGDKSALIQQWLSNHWGCNLRFVMTDEQLDKLWDEGYEPWAAAGSSALPPGLLVRKSKLA